MLDDLRSGIAAGSKSSAGDKHETATAMAQLEQEQLHKQLFGLQQQIGDLNRIDIRSTDSLVSAGSLVYTSNGNYYLATAMGKVVVDEESYVVLSAQSPLGSKLLGSGPGDSVVFNGISYLILRLE